MISKIKAAIAITAFFFVAIFWAIIERIKNASYRAQRQSFELRQSAEMKAHRQRKNTREKYDDLAEHWLGKIKETSEDRARKIQSINENESTAAERFNSYRGPDEGDGK